MAEDVIIVFTGCTHERGQKATRELLEQVEKTEYEIETRRTTGSATRVTDHCATPRNQVELARRLRRAFDKP